MKKSALFPVMVLAVGILAGGIIRNIGEAISIRATAQLPTPSRNQAVGRAQSNRRASADGQTVIDLRETKIPPVGAKGDSFAESSDKSDVNEIFRERYDELLPEERVGIQIYEKRNRSIVNVDTVMVRQGNLFFTEEAEGRGSGIVLTKDGVILTNFHVVEGADSISVTLFDGQEFTAHKIGDDGNSDIALLKIDAPAESLYPVEFGDSSTLLVGQIVYAIGNPFGHDRTMTRGIVSNLNRTINSPQQSRQIKGVIQIDAAINPGNSGGALFDSRGRMIGMNTAIASRVGENSGVGFAIPVNTISRIGTILLEQGRVVRGNAGIVQVTEIGSGILPSLIDEGGAADRAGLRGVKVVVSVFRQNGIEYQGRRKVIPKEGMDIIVGVNDQKVKTGEDFISLVEEHKPGETIELDIIRQGRPMKLSVVLD